jgi:hypothetical protein
VYSVSDEDGKMELRVGGGACKEAGGVGWYHRGCASVITGSSSGGGCRK